MIFGRKRKDATPESPLSPDEPAFDDDLDDDDDLDEEVESASGEDTDDEIDDDESDDSEAEEKVDPWDEYDASQDWREDGPFDYDEVELEGDDVPRIDLGSLIVTPEDGMQLQIVADEATRQGLALVVALGESAMQLEVRAAPNSGGFARELRDDIVAETSDAEGRSELAKGPFGTEVRRVVPATDPQGNQGFAPMRDWFAEGPRWLLNGRLMGAAALDSEGEAAAPFEEFFRNLIVRRGDEPMAPGQIVPLVLPQG